jgi:hypothetical protein
MPSLAVKQPRSTSRRRPAKRRSLLPGSASQLRRLDGDAQHQPPEGGQANLARRASIRV